MSKIGDYDLPDELYYHNDHAWVRIEADGNVTVGMNDFYQKSAGDTTYVDLPFEGDEVEQGETVGKIQSAKWEEKRFYNNQLPPLLSLGKLNILLVEFFYIILLISHMPFLISLNLCQFLYHKHDN